MPLDITDAIERGARRTLARNGLVLVGIVYVLGVLSGLFGPRRSGVGSPELPGGAPPVARPDPVIGVSPLLAALVGFVFTLLSLAVTVGAIRVFLTDETERLPADAFTRRFVPAFVNVLLGGIVFSILVFVGFLLLVVPGIFLLVSLAFWAVYVVDEDVNFVDGFRRSWRLTSGHRLRLFLLGLAVLLAVFLVSAVFGLVSIVAGSVVSVLGVVIGQIGSAFTTVFTWAILAAAYDQLSADPVAGDVTVDAADDEFRY